MSSDPSPSPGYSADDSLPPVEPPSAGFIVQLFVVPGVIVLVVVTIWVMFSWLAQKGNDGEAYVKALSRNNEARWQAATNLATALRAEEGSKSPTLTNDPVLAKKLADILDREIETASMQDNSLTLRLWLSLALGAFKVPDGLPTLIKAAGTNRDEKEGDVQRAAIEGIALLADHSEDRKPFTDNAPLEAVIEKAAADPDARTRSVAAVALGVIGMPKMIEKLHYMLEDTNPNVRYNAAARLAQRGDVAAIPVLEEMLDPAEMAGVDLEQNKEAKPFKRALITLNALRATSQLATKNSDADLKPLEAAVKKLLSGEISGETRVEATGVLHQLEHRTAKQAA